MRTTWLKLVGCHCDAWPCQCGLSAATALTDRLTGGSDRRAVQWMNESLAKGANGQQSCWHTDHTQPHTHTRLHVATHTHSATHTHTWHVNKSAAFAVSRSSAWLGFALMLCCILYGVLGTLRVCQLPVASNRFVCIPFCLSASLSAPSCTLSFSPVHVSHTAVFQFAQKTRMSIAASSISMWLWDWFLACRLSDSLTVWLLVCFSSSSFLCSAAYFCISITWFAAFAAQTADNCAPDGMRIWLTCEPVRV